MTGEAQHSAAAATSRAPRCFDSARARWGWEEVLPANRPPRIMSSSSLFTYQDATEPSAPTDRALQLSIYDSLCVQKWIKQHLKGWDEERLCYREGHAVDLRSYIGGKKRGIDLQILGLGFERRPGAPSTA